MGCAVSDCQEKAVHHPSVSNLLDHLLWNHLGQLTSAAGSQTHLQLLSVHSFFARVHHEMMLGVWLFV